MRHFDYAISVGANCRVAYQLRRVFGRDAVPSGIFDWQTTRQRALLAYIERDFAGMFEFEDLTVVSGGSVQNRRFRTRHFHEFPVGIRPEEIAEHYPKARARHDHLAQKTLALLRGRHRLLLCFSEPVSLRSRLRLMLSLRWKYPQARIRLLSGPNDIQGDPDRWRGTDAIWDRHLAGFTVSPPVRHADAADAADA